MKRFKTLQQNRGFTIVELLIVIVVIAILATITIVSYNSIANRANDSARKSDASLITKAAELRQAEHDTYGFGATYPEGRDDLLQVYTLQPLTERLVICGYDECPSAGFDKKKIYVSVGGNWITYAYWSHAENTWHNHDFYDGEHTRSTSTEADGPLDLGTEGPSEGGLTSILPVGA